MTIHSFRRTAAPGLALALVLGLAACSGGDSNPATPGDEEFLAGSPSQTTGPTSSPDTDASEDPSGSPGAAEPNAAALRAIAVAEDDAGGTAYAVEGAGASVWEVDVAVDDRTVQVEVNADGDVLSTGDGDLDVDDRSAVDDAAFALPDAIDRVLAFSGGTLEEAELDDPHWSVTVDEQGDDVDYRVHLETGELTGDE
ncbi:hypothetical protein BCE75_11176 [Isoptericola sp. CG 20/1183]|uniref:PepSY domain-containing protein n=1 Tax=Isoptericola halotolerans TaxID=300560 RepID=A0ABX5EK36_9MICO|nr:MULTISPECIES: PepSY domain-containing protein [Isoptericola]PRZ04155.1 hypothetical protein BCE75_11176 [Isoptericola sp. CG 20/1183]PRZ10020.1 hypothetical protein BCL65_101158 [Isoptericola halotolerans]